VACLASATAPLRPDGIGGRTGLGPLEGPQILPIGGRPQDRTAVPAAGNWPRTPGADNNKRGSTLHIMPAVAPPPCPNTMKPPAPTRRPWKRRCRRVPMRRPPTISQHQKSRRPFRSTITTHPQATCCVVRTWWQHGVNPVPAGGGLPPHKVRLRPTTARRYPHKTHPATCRSPYPHARQVDRESTVVSIGVEDPGHEKLTAPRRRGRSAQPPRQHRRPSPSASRAVAAPPPP